VFLSLDGDDMDSQDSVTPHGPERVPTDRSLLRRMRSGSEDAATQLYLRYAQRLRALIRAHTSPQVQRHVEAEDLVQSVFRRFFRRVREGDYDVPPGEELWGLFLVIALNRIRAEETFQRAGKRDLRRTIHGGDAPLDPPDQHDENSLTVLQLTIADAMGKLPVPQREMLELRIQGHEVAEIARLTGRSKRTVERNLQEVRTSLRSSLELPTPDDSLNLPESTDESDDAG
jgi:RNA polymerase sigma-70 factor, ECF subfamily